MPVKGALQPAQLRDLRHRLETRLVELRREVEDALHPTGDDTPAELPNAHRETDDAVADVESDIAVAAAERDAGELVAVVAALGRFDDGQYGFCVACGEALPYSRLSAVPHASRCVRCQSVVERASEARRTI